MSASNDVEPYFAVRWYTPGRTAGDAFAEAKAACAAAWRKRADSVEALTFTEFARTHLHGEWTERAVYAPGAD